MTNPQIIQKCNEIIETHTEPKELNSPFKSAVNRPEWFNEDIFRTFKKRFAEKDQYNNRPIPESGLDKEMIEKFITEYAFAIHELEEEDEEKAAWDFC